MSTAEKSGSLVVCISPLTSLMIDQKSKYTNKGLAIEFVGDEENSKEKILNCEYQLLLISPGRAIGNPTYRAMFLTPKCKTKLVGLVVDEAHCVCTWGDEFRTVFAQIGELQSLIPAGVNIMALTATTTSSTLTIVSRRLSMDNPVVVASKQGQYNI